MLKFISLLLAFASATVSASAASLAKYSITNSATGYYLISDGTEVVGSEINTISSEFRNISATLLNIYPPSCNPANFITVVIGQAGLYVSVSQTKAGTYLTWHSQPYLWEFTPMMSDPWNTFTISVFGYDLYWYDDWNNIADHFVIQDNNQPQAPVGSNLFQVESL